MTGTTSPDRRRELTFSLDQHWIAREIDDVNMAIQDAARSRGMQYVDIYDTHEGYELCSGSSESFMNGIEPRIGNPPTKPESYHPDAFGHSLLADTLAEELQTQPPGRTTTVSPGETVTFLQDVVAGVMRSSPPRGRAATSR